jgi:tRNA-dependent cyclodipeptide synthase
MIVKSQIKLGTKLIENPKSVNAFIGVSLGKPFYSKENIEKYFLWAEKHCKKFILILADEPEKWNYQAFKRLTKSESLSFAQKVGGDYKRGFLRIINKHNLKNIEVKVWKDLFENNQEYEEILAIFKKHFSENKQFREDCIKTIRQNLGQKINEELEGDKEKIVADILSNYLLEELAATIWFIKNGFPIEINPRELVKLNESIYTNKYKHLSKDLGFSNEWGYIQLTI